MNDKYRRIEEMLYDYRGNEHEIRDIEIEINKIRNNYNGISGICYEEKTSSGNDISSIVESEVISKEQKIEKLEKVRMKRRMDSQKVENALELLTDIEREVVVGKYLDRLEWFKIAYKIGYSESWTKSIRRQAVEKLTKRIHL